MDKSQIKIIYGLFLLMVWLAGCAPVEPGLAATAAPTRELPPVTATQAAIPTQAETATPMPTATISAPACSPASIESGSTGAGLLDKPMDYYVVLPPCYQQGEKKYPVLYLLHGLNANQQQWLDLGIGQKAAEMMLAGEIPPFLIVLPFDYSFKQPGEYRFEEVFLEHLIPEIKTAYRVQTDRSARAVGGLSRGGAWAIYLASRNPETFAIIGAHSPVVFPSTGGALTLLLRDMPLELRPTFYVDAGDRDIDFRGIQAFTNLLNSYGYPHEWRQNLGYHDEAYWKEQVEEYLRWYGRQFSVTE